MEDSIYKKFLDSSLLEGFKKVAPGTYKHCVNVADFCESISKEINLDPVLLRVAALYHDIGKIFNSNYFSENQNGTNPHDDLDPFTSYHIITRHVSDGVTILVENDFPIEVIKIVSQHHGDSVLRYFYDKAELGDEEIDKYRYKNSPPQTPEAAVLLISDSIEARARALFSVGKLKSDELVNDTLERLISEGQLDNLKIGLLNKMKPVLYKELDTLYHKREVYENDKE